MKALRCAGALLVAVLITTSLFGSVVLKDFPSDSTPSGAETVMGPSVTLQEHKAVLSSSNQYVLDPNELVSGNDYFLLPGQTIPKDTYILINEKPEIPMVLQLEVVAVNVPDGVEYALTDDWELQKETFEGGTYTGLYRYRGDSLPIGSPISVLAGDCFVIAADCTAKHTFSLTFHAWLQWR